MLRKLSSELSSKSLRRFVKKAMIQRHMNVHQDGTIANQVYSQLAANPKTNNRVKAAHPMVQRELPVPPSPTTFNPLFKL